MHTYWQTFLGAHIPFQSEELCFLTYDEEHPRVLIARLPGTTDRVEEAAGMQHVSFTYRNLDELALAYEQRKEYSMSPYWCVNHGGTTSLYYKDPEGNNIETQVDNFDTADEANEFLRTDAFRKNPICIDFDPEDLVRTLRAGESHETIKKGAYGTQTRAVKDRKW